MKKVLVSTIFLFILFVFFVDNSSAYSIGGSSLPTPPALNLNPLDSGLLENIIPGIGLGTTLPKLNLLNTNNLSGNDLVYALKSVAVLAINLFLIVIQTVASILKALLPFLQ